MKRQRPVSENVRGRRVDPERRDYFVFGLLPVLELLRADSRKVEKISVAAGSRQHRFAEVYERARDKGIPVHSVPRESLDRLVGPDANHQGVVAQAVFGEYADADRLLERLDETALLLILDGIEDPRNLGAVMRTAECAGVDAVFIPERRAVGLTESAARSSAGAVEHLPVAKVQNLNRLIEDLKERGVWVVGTSADAATDHYDWDWARPTALVMGSEGGGLHRLVAANCDVLVKIPMYGKIQSLNVSVAAGVVLFEARRQRAQVPKSE